MAKLNFHFENNQNSLLANFAPAQSLKSGKFVFGQEVSGNMMRLRLCLHDLETFSLEIKHEIPSNKIIREGLNCHLKGLSNFGVT